MDGVGYGGQGLAAQSASGSFIVTFTDANCCQAPGHIKIVQAYIPPGGFYAWQGGGGFDSSPDQAKANSSTKGGTPWPGITSVKKDGNNYSFQDSPGTDAFPTVTNLDDCAVCECNGKDTVIGCVSFTWTSHDNTISDYSGSVPIPPGSIFNNAAAQWKKDAGH